VKPRAIKLAALGTACVVGLLTVAGCGEAHQLTGFQRQPLPAVGDVSLPDLTDDGRPFALRATPGDLLIVYFGYTNCPDFCPTTMSDVKLARARLDHPERISVAMVTVDPGRDLVTDPERCADPVLACYVRSFIADGHALGTDDAAALSRAAAPFGAAYHVSTSADGEVAVEHTTFLYAVDDSGHLLLTWQFGVKIDDLTADLRQLLKQQSSKEASG
jgi:protein SCO1/2